MKQLSFTDIFAAEAFENQTAHLPAAMQEAIPYFRQLIERNDAAMRACDFDLVTRLSEEAHDLAVKLNAGDAAILADHDSPGNVLERETAAPSGTVPQWGQTGDFIIDLGSMKVHIEMDGIFGLGMGPIPGFVAHAVEYDQPFLSSTGYRYFYRGAPKPDMTPATYAEEMVRQHVAGDLKGKLCLIQTHYRPSPATKESHDACCIPRPPDGG